MTVSLTDFDRILCKYLDFSITYELYRTKNKAKYSFACGHLEYQLLSTSHKTLRKLKFWNKLMLFFRTEKYSSELAKVPKEVTTMMCTTAQDEPSLFQHPTVN